MDFFIDVSYWQSAWTLEKYKLLKEYGMKAMVIRAGYSTWVDKLASTHISYCREMNIPFGLYWYIYPGVPYDVQIRAFIGFANNYPDCKCYFIDFEEYRNLTMGEIYRKDILEKYYKDSYDYLVKVLPNKKVGVYTGSWCVNQYFPKISSWMNNSKEWYAFYVKYLNWFKNYISSLGGYWADNSKPISISNLPQIMNEIWKHASEFQLPVGVTNWGAWQCVTFIAFKELTYGQRNLDYNLAPPEILKEWFGVEGVPVPEPPVIIEPPIPEATEPPYVSKKYKVKAWILNIRDGVGVGSKITGQYLYFGNIISSLDEINDWIKIDKGWVSKAQLEEYVFVSGTWYVTTEGVNLRSTPDTTKVRIGSLAAGTQVQVDEITNGWAKLIGGGYVYAYYLKEASSQ